MTVLNSITLSNKCNVLPEQTCHGMSTYIVQSCVVLVLLSVRCVWVQALPELRVPLVQLPGQSLVPTHKGLAKLGGCVAHCFTLARGHRLEAVTGPFLPAYLPPPSPPLPPPPFATGHTLEQHGSVFFFPAKG